MDRAILLSMSQGGIITPEAPYSGSPKRIREWLPNMVPYVENVPLPVISVDSSAIYGDHPENLVNLTTSNGAALTFFVDSVAGGNDSSGDGSYGNPWRSLNTASKFLECAWCHLNTAFPYIQIKVRGTVDYISSSWNPAYYGNEKLILTGWGGRCDLGDSGVFFAEHFFDLRVSAYWPNDNVYYSGCEIIGGGRSTHYAINCSLGEFYSASAIYNCSGGTARASAIQGGKYVCDPFEGGCAGRYIYGAEFSGTNDGSQRLDTVLFVGAAAVSARVNASTAAPGGITAIYATSSSVYLADCHASAIASNTATSQAFAHAFALYGNAPIVSGGTFVAIASATANYSGMRVSAIAEAYGLPQMATAANVYVDLRASASAHTTNLSSGVEEIESRVTSNLLESCAQYTARRYSSGVLVSTYNSSSGVCS